MIKMDEVNKIRKDFFSYGKSRHELSQKYNHSWDTINRIINMSREELDNRGKRPGRVSLIFTEEVRKAVEAYLQEEQEKRVKRKQRYTAKRIFEDLKEKGIYKGSRRDSARHCQCFTSKTQSDQTKEFFTS